MNADSFGGLPARGGRANAHTATRKQEIPEITVGLAFRRIPARSQKNILFPAKASAQAPIPRPVWHLRASRVGMMRNPGYSSRGVSEYWIVNQESRTVEIHRKRKEGGLEFIGSLQESDDLTTPLPAGFRVHVATLFET
jgi:hypothetical protein